MTRHYRMLTTTTASSDIMITLVTSCAEVVGCTRHCAIFPEKRRLASKNSGS